MKKVNSYSSINSDENSALLAPKAGAFVEGHWLPEGTDLQFFFFLFALLSVFASMFIFLVPTRDSDSLYLTLLDDGARLQLKLLPDNDDNYKYLRVDKYTNKLLLTDSFPRVQSSTFEVHSHGECFKLKSLSGNWLRFDPNEGNIGADATSSLDATLLVAVAAKPLSNNTIDSSNMYSSNGVKIKQNGVPIMLKVCERNYWLQQEGISVIVKEHSSSSFFSLTGSNSNLNTDEYEYAEMNATVFEIETVEQVKGVNLGGWFIPEVWMDPWFFADTGLGWGGSLCRMVNYSRELTEERMLYNLKTWIKESDFAEISKAGFNSVRLPIGYWNIIKDPYDIYAPADHTVSIKYIDWAFDTAEKYGLTVLLDLHGGAGSQNGYDHSGCGQKPQWLHPDNINLSLKAIEAMAKRYSHRPNLMGFELLNEPAETYSAHNHTILQEYYEKAYKIVREHSPTAIVLFNELYSYLYGKWNQFLLEPDYYNVIVDWHLYEWPHRLENISAHIEHAYAWKDIIETYSIHHPIIVGEWCMSTGKNEAGQPFVDATLDSFQSTWGWYLWTWKIQKGIGFEAWDVQSQIQMSNGLDPLKNNKMKGNLMTESQVTSEEYNLIQEGYSKPSELVYPYEEDIDKEDFIY
jgi:glucan 1,3-beta-glucosidase